MAQLKNTVVQEVMILYNWIYTSHHKTYTSRLRCDFPAALRAALSLFQVRNFSAALRAVPPPFLVRNFFAALRAVPSPFLVRNFLGSAAHGDGMLR